MCGEKITPTHKKCRNLNNSEENLKNRRILKVVVCGSSGNYSQTAANINKVSNLRTKNKTKTNSRANDLRGQHFNL